MGIPRPPEAFDPRIWMTKGRRRLASAAAAALSLAACGPSPLPAPPRGHAADKVAPDKTHAAAVLANVENARFALSRRDGAAAQNDVLRAIAAAQHLPDETQNIFVDEPTGRPQRLGPFPVRALLIDARTALAAGDPVGADRALAAVLAGVPLSVIPTHLPLVSARESLALAAVAAKHGEKRQLGIQLEDAKWALDRYAAQSHSKAVRALADEIGLYAEHPEKLARLSVEQPLLWAGKIQG